MLTALQIPLGVILSLDPDFPPICTSSSSPSGEGSGTLGIVAAVVVVVVVVVEISGNGEMPDAILGTLNDLAQSTANS